MNEAAARHRNRTRNEPNNIVWEFITLLAGKRLRDTACREAFARITRDLPCAARLRATMASEMLHKFKIGQTVNYHPKDRILSTARGTYTVTGLMPALEGQQREYRIRHFSGRSRMNFGGALRAHPGSLDL